MKILLHALLLLLPSAAFCAKQTVPQDTLQIVESVPQETVYGSTMTLRPVETWVDMIKGAKKTLDIGVFYIATEKGEAMEPVLKAIADAGARGVKVRVMVDSKMYGSNAAGPDFLKKQKNVEVRVIDFNKIDSGVMHAKYFVVDGTRLFVGSQNFDWRALSQIHEIGAKVNSRTIAAAFEQVFEADWAFAEKNVWPFDDTELASAKDSMPGPGRMEILTYRGEAISAYPVFSPGKFLPSGLHVELVELLRIIDSAKASVDIQVMNYSLKNYSGPAPWTELDSALRNAGERGVKVRLIVADWTLNRNTVPDIKSLARAKNVSVKVSSIPQHSKGFMEYARVEHCKYLVADGETSWISTANWERSYFYSTRNATLILLGKQPAFVLEDVFSKAWNGPYTTPVEQDREYQPVKKSK